MLLKTLHYAGLRREEAAGLDVGDIDFERKRITVRKGKGGKTRIVPVIEDELLVDLKYLLGKRTSGYVFILTQGNGDRKLTTRQMNHIVARAGAMAGIQNPNPGLKHINPHLFRHSIARYLKNKGFSAEWIQKFLGHASFKTTMRMYGNLSIDEIQEEIEKKLLD